MIEQPKKIEYDIKSVNDTMIHISGMFGNTQGMFNSTRSNNSDDRKAQISGTRIKTVTSGRTKRECNKRRKNVSSTTKVISTLIDDGYDWRKYGQKMILNSKHQRNYYRCTHKLEQGCQATKQVQKINDKPSKYRITYNGLHTCNNLQSASQIIMEAPSPTDKSVLISFETNTFTENHKVYCGSPTRKNTPKESFLSLGPFKQEQVSSSHYHIPWDPIMGISQVPSEPMYMMSSGLDCEDMVSSCVFSSTWRTHSNEIDDLLESCDFGDFFFELFP